VDKAQIYSLENIYILRKEFQMEMCDGFLTTESSRERKALFEVFASFYCGNVPITMDFKL
jgi:hypothetical protein